jgi:hypothetical protein
LKPDDSNTRLLLSTLQTTLRWNDYEPAAAEMGLGRPPIADGVFGPVTKRMFERPHHWCAVPDFVPPKEVHFQFEDPNLQQVCARLQENGGFAPAVGSGNWPRCHGVGNFHAVSVSVNMRGIASFLAPVFKEVLRLVRVAYAKIGLLIYWIDSETGRDMITGKAWSGPINIEFSFVARSDGWIGLAIVGRNQGCSSRIWCRYLATYRPSDIIREWVTLVKHEIGHNCGSGHLAGFTMNPSIMRGLPSDSWDSRDPYLRYLRSNFGGQPVPIGEPPPPPPPPPPPGNLEARVAKNEHDVQDLKVGGNVHMSQIADLTRRVKALEVQNEIRPFVADVVPGGIVQPDHLPDPSPVDVDGIPFGWSDEFRKWERS